MSASINVNTTNVIFRKIKYFNAFGTFVGQNLSRSLALVSMKNPTGDTQSRPEFSNYMKCRLSTHEKPFSSRRTLSILQFAKILIQSQPHALTVNKNKISAIHSTAGFQTADTNRECWKCGETTDFPNELFFCKCGVVQRAAKDLNYFQLFGIEEGFDIDLKPLSEKYIQLQKQLHPDKFSQASEAEQTHAAEQSSLVNKAYSVLSKPLHRAIYMLELHNNPIGESQAISDPELLMAIMETNEELADVSNPDELRSIEEQNNLNIDNCLQDISKAFKSKDIEEAHNLVIKFQYYSNISEKIKELQRSWIK